MVSSCSRSTPAAGEAHQARCRLTAAICCSGNALRTAVIAGFVRPARADKPGAPRGNIDHVVSSRVTLARRSTGVILASAITIPRLNASCGIVHQHRRTGTGLGGRQSLGAVYSAQPEQRIDSTSRPDRLQISSQRVERKSASCFCGHLSSCLWLIALFGAWVTQPASSKQGRLRRTFLLETPRAVRGKRRVTYSPGCYSFH